MTEPIEAAALSIYEKRALQIIKLATEQAEEIRALRPAASGDLRERIAQALCLLRDVAQRKETWTPECDRVYQGAQQAVASLPCRDDEAIRAEERERCAKVARDCASEFAAGSLIDPNVHVARKVAQHIESAIQSLKTERGS